MKGSRVFSRSTADRIRSLLARTRAAEPPQQKALRQDIRDLRFYISDFHRPATGLAPEDFDELVRTKQIEIV
jgi:hypothetical protein